MLYRNIELCSIPSGLGGIFPAAIAERYADGSAAVICLHPEYYTDWVFTQYADNIKPFSHRLTDDMKRIIDSRLTHSTAASLEDTKPQAQIVRIMAQL